MAQRIPPSPASRWLAAATLCTAVLLVACGGDDDEEAVPASAPRVSTQSFYTGGHFLADSRLAANPDNGVLVVLHNPAQLGASAAAALDKLGFDVVPYDFLDTGPRTYCWDGAARQAAGGGVPHRMVLRDEARREVLVVEEGGPCVTQTIAAGRYTALLRFGEGRSSALDLVFLMPQQDTAARALAASRAAAAAAAATPVAAVPVWTCPQAILTFDDIATSEFVLQHAPLEAVTVTGACGDIGLIAPSASSSSTTYLLYYAGPNTQVTVYSETGFRGSRKLITPNLNFYDYNGHGYPQARSMVAETYTPSTSRTTLLSTNACEKCNLQAVDLSNQPLQGAVLNDADLSRADLSHADLSNAKAARALFASAHLVGTKLSGAVLTNAIFQSDGAVPNGGGAVYPAADLSSADLSSARLDNVVMTGVSAVGTTFAHATLASTDFSGADLSGSSFESASAPAGSPPVFNLALMARASLKNAQLPGAFFRGTQMSPSNLGGANLAGAWMESDAGGQGPTILAGSYMANTDLSAAHMVGAVLDGASWFNSSPGVGNASGANAILTGASFNLADLPNLDLRNAVLQSVNMTNTQLINADLTSASAGGGTTCGTKAVFGTANLRGATLIGADLSCANLYNAAVSTTDEGKVYIEVLADPDRYQKPVQYQYFAVNRPPTKLGGGSSGTAVITDNATCPSGKKGSCGMPTGLPGDPWTPPVGPVEPSNCTTTVDPATGDVIAVTCTSGRH
ncbi:pentapeptide repeat-containing protein [Rivibacter subsaxonicus]|uniref:Uncharacterized protein YjbI with pentapeptide repeats n=1 Tax=Rivibacter subsaxonicus TaxID=457575 RepID=A0A4Q7VP86_9BURK|nr:pentapeptide repeat-containing protein [Rivibacter subsaxonicus]RZT97997.1 uncharacterized protein YjbI with pentapeptide repeats [Rivibacter subsaxonicus]